jgi:hypothetical protein
VIVKFHLAKALVWLSYMKIKFKMKRKVVFGCDYTKNYASDILINDG